MNRWEQPDPQAVALFEERYGTVSVERGVDGLATLVRRFAGLPYENISKILAWEAGALQPHPRRPRQVMTQHLELGTGGTCYSLTELLRQLVQSRGLDAYPVMAHMRHGPNVHCALRVELRGRAYLLDPGYLVGEPLPLEPSREADWRLGEAHLVAAGSLPGVPETVPRVEGELDLFTMEPDGPRWRYRFTDQAPSRAAFERHWLESFHLPGMRSLVVTRRDQDGQRLYLHNHKLRVRGPKRRINRNIRETLAPTVRELFGIDDRVASAAWELLATRRAPGG